MSLPGAGDGPFALATDVDLGTLGEHAGELVRIGGLVVEPTASGFRLDDGTAIAAVTLEADAAAYRGLLETGDAVNAIGIVVGDPSAPDAWSVLVTTAAGLLRVGDLGEPRTVLGDAPNETPLPTPSAEPSNRDVRDARRLGLDHLLVEATSGPLAVLSLVLMAVLSLTSALIRRRRLRAVARIEARIARYAGARSRKP